MRLNYYLKKRDIFLGRMSLLVRRKLLLAISILSICFLTYSLSTGPEVTSQAPLVRIVFSLLVFGFAAVSYLALFGAINVLMILTSRNAGLVGWHTLEIKEDGLEECTEVNKSLYRWNPSFKVLESGNYLWIYPTDGQYFQIPKRAGGYEGNLSEFAALLKTKVQK